MSNRTQHNQPDDPGQPSRAPGGLPADLPRAARIRAAADGELPPSTPIDPADAPRVAFERDLRKAVNRAIPQATAPAELRASIERLFREHAPAAPPAILTPAAGDTRDRAFWNRSGRWLAAAAVLALSATVVFMATRSGGTGGVGPFGGAQGALQVASFVERESDACSDLNDRFNRKFKATSPEEARRLADEVFESTPSALLAADDALLSLGYRFAGFGRCAVPGEGASAHLIYHSDAGPADALSLFIQELSPDAGLQKANCYLLDCPNDDRDRVVAWRDEHFVYYLFSRSERATAAARTVFHTPTHEIEVR